MSNYLYAHNFRGFTNSTIPIVDVNFLVGENSSGKSSIMVLIRLLSDLSGLLLDQSFSNTDTGFEQFADMVSVHSEDQSYFQVGFVSEMLPGRNAAAKQERAGCLFTFVQKDGKPYLHKFTLSRGPDEVTLVRQSGGDTYYKKSSSPPSATALIDVLRERRTSDHRVDDVTDFVQVPPNAVKLPLFMLVAVMLAGRQGTENDMVHTIIPFLSANLAWFSPIRARPSRTYDKPIAVFSPEGEHTPYTLRDFLNSIESNDSRIKTLQRIGKDSGLFQSVEIRDFGAKSDPVARFEVNIVIDDKPLNIINVGSGVSQSLPIIVEILLRARSTWYAIQQPEVHLHPRAQAALGELFFAAAADSNKRLLVETHSDFIIDRFRMKYRDDAAVKPDSQVLFFERRDKQNIVTPIAIDEAGELSSEQPESYREFFVREQMDLLGI